MTTRRRDPAPPLSKDEIERILSNMSSLSPEEMAETREFLESEIGSQLIHANRRLDDAKTKIRDFVCEVKQAMLGDSIEPVYALIGEFIVKFSQIEFWLRFVFIAAIQVRQSNIDNLILSKLDFQSLLSITEALYERRYANAPSELKKRVYRIFAGCHQLNGARIRVAHGSWFITESEMAALHLSRQTMTESSYFTRRDDLKKEIANLDRIDSEMRALLSGDYDPPDEDEP